MRKLLLIFLALLLSSAFSQTNAIDSISTLLKTDKEDTNKVKHLNDLAWEFIYQNPDTSILISTHALEVAATIVVNNKQGWPKGIAQSNSDLGIYYRLKADYPKALEYHFKSLKLNEEIGNKNNIAANLGSIGNVYLEQGDYPKALEYHFKALKMNKEIGNKKGMAANLGNIGIVYQEQGDYANALEYHFKSLKLNEEIGNKNSMATNLGNIGNVYLEQGDYPKALEHLFKSLKLNEEIGNKNHMAGDLANIGNVYIKQGDHENALQCYFKALKLNEEIGDKRSMAEALGYIGNAYLREKKFKEAEEYLLEALKASTEIGALNLIKDHNEALSDLYSQTNRYELAYEHYKLFTTAKDSLFNEDKSKEIGRLEMRHEIEIAEMERQRVAVEELKLKTQKTERRNLLEYSGMVIGLLIIGLMITIFGFVKVKPWLAEGITFFAFLLFFEFMLVLLDPYMDKFTKGEPAFKLLINAAVALCIFPIHAFFEKKLKKRLMRK